MLYDLDVFEDIGSTKFGRCQVVCYTKTSDFFMKIAG